jgi:hypothetical protein
MAKQPTTNENETPEPDANARLDVVEGSLKEIKAGFNSMVDVMQSMQTTMETLAKNHVVQTNRFHEAAEQQLGQDRVTQFDDQNNEILISETGIADVNSPQFKAKAAALAYYNEKVTVYIQTVNDEQADTVFDIGVNGEIWKFRRGDTRTVPRYVVEGLATAKPVGFKSVEFKDSHGKTNYREQATTGLRYPFNLVNASQKDQQWLNSVLARRE